MAFSFGSSTPAPSAGFSFGGGGGTATAPSGGGFGAPAPGSFGFGAPAPAVSGGFGEPAAASGGLGAPSTGGGFGAAPSSFGFSQPAPAPGGSIFGAPAAAAPAGNLFGFSSQPPPAATTALTPPQGSPFETPSAGAVDWGGSWGRATTDFSPWSLPSGAPQQQQPFGSSNLSQQVAVPPPAPTIAGNMYYSQLTPEMKRAIDNMHEAITRHKRTMFNLQTMGPKLLVPPEQTTTTTTRDIHRTAPNLTPLQTQIQRLQVQSNRLQHDTEKLRAAAQQQHRASETAMVQTTLYAQWPVEALAARRGVRWSTDTAAKAEPHGEEKKSDDGVAAAALHHQIREALNRAMAAVDRIDRMPSPYYWETLHTLEQRAAQLSDQAKLVQNQLDQSRALTRQITFAAPAAVTIHEIVETQHVALSRLTAQWEHWRDEMQRVRYRYSKYERGEDVLVKAAAAELERQRKLQEQLLLHYLQASTTSEASSAPSAAAPVSNFATGGGSSSTTAAPAPFGAPATTANLFGNTATTTNSFGGTSFPSTASAGPAPTTNFGFASTTAQPSSSKKKSGSRSSSRLRR